MSSVKSSPATAPYHAHVYYTSQTCAVAAALHSRLRNTAGQDGAPGLLFVGQMRDRKVGPHPEPQFEVHFLKDQLPRVLQMLETSGLTALVHPLTDDDLADHTSLAHWIGSPLPLDLSTLDAPGMNQGIDRFGKSDV